MPYKPNDTTDRRAASTVDRRVRCEQQTNAVAKGHGSRVRPAGGKYEREERPVPVVPDPQRGTGQGGGEPANAWQGGRAGGDRREPKVEHGFEDFSALAGVASVARVATMGPIATMGPVADVGNVADMRNKEDDRGVGGVPPRQERRGEDRLWAVGVRDWVQPRDSPHLGLSTAMAVG